MKLDDPDRYTFDPMDEELREATLRKGDRESLPKGYPTDRSEYADPENWKYPIDRGHIHAAISYFSKPTNAGQYPERKQKRIWARIRRAAEKFGVELGDKSGPPSVEKCSTPGQKIRSGGKGRGLAHGQGEGPLAKSKYIRRWKGKTGKWEYEYPEDKKKAEPGESVALAQAEDLGSKEAEAAVKEDRTMRAPAQHAGIMQMIRDKKAKTVRLLDAYNNAMMKKYNELKKIGQAGNDSKQVTKVKSAVRTHVPGVGIAVTPGEKTVLYLTKDYDNRGTISGKVKDVSSLHPIVSSLASDRYSDAALQELGATRADIEKIESVIKDFAKKNNIKKSMDTSGVSGIDQLGDFAKAMYIGPRGGKWADPEHTIPYDEEKRGKPGVTLVDKTKSKKKKKEPYQVQIDSNMVVKELVGYWSPRLGKFDPTVRGESQHSNVKESVARDLKNKAAMDFYHSDWNKKKKTEFIKFGKDLLKNAKGKGPENLIKYLAYRIQHNGAASTAFHNIFDPNSSNFQELQSFAVALRKDLLPGAEKSGITQEQQNEIARWVEGYTKEIDQYGERILRGVRRATQNFDRLQEIAKNRLSSNTKKSMEVSDMTGIGQLNDFAKAKYIRRWKGKNGKWEYEYPEDKKKEGSAGSSSQDGPRVRTTSPEEQKEIRKQFRKVRGKASPIKGVVYGQVVEYQGKPHAIYDFDADARSPSGVTLVLVSPGFKTVVSDVPASTVIKDEGKQITKKSMEVSDMHGIDQLDNFAKAETMPTGNPKFGEGKEQGGKLDGKGKTKGKHDSAAGSPTGAESPKKDKLSEDDEDDEKQMKPHKKPIETLSAKSMLPADQRAMVAHQEAQIVSQIKKGEQDYTIEGIPEEHEQDVVTVIKGGEIHQELVTYTESADIAAERLLKSDDFYSGGTPSLAPRTRQFGLNGVCPKCGGQLAKSITACPTCGYGASKPMVVNLPEQDQVIQKSRPGVLRPKREQDIKID